MKLEFDKYKQTAWVMILFVIASLWFGQPLFLDRSGSANLPGQLFQTHNLMFDSHEKIHLITRLVEYGNGLANWNLYPRLQSGFAGGYGYPFFYFYAPLSYGLASLWTLISFDAFMALKIHIMIAMFTAMTAMYFLVKDLWKSQSAAIISALLYGFAPYHISNIYIRGGIAEFTAMSILPLVFMGYHKLLTDPSRRWVIITSIAHAALVLTHNITALFATGILAVYCVVASLAFRSRNTKHIAMTFLLAFSLSSFFWLPAIVDIRDCGSHSVMSNTYNETPDHVLNIKQLLNGEWEYGLSVKGSEDSMPFFIGTPLLILFLTSIYYIINKKSQLNSDSRISAIIIGIFAFGTVLSTTSLFTFIWRIPGFNLIQFPWRMLSFGSLFLAVFCGYGTSYFFKEEFLSRKKINLLILSVSVLGILIWANPMLRVNGYFPNQAGMYSAAENRKHYMTTNIGEFLPNTAQNSHFIGTINPRRILLGSHDSTQVTPSEFLNYQYKGTVQDGTVITYPAFYFKAWHATVNGTAIALKPTADGLIQTPPLSGSIDLHIWFGYSKAGRIGNALSLMGGGVIFILIISMYIKRKPIDTSH